MEGTNYYISLICRSMQGFGGENGVDWREREGRERIGYQNSEKSV